MVQSTAICLQPVGGGASIVATAADDHDVTVPYSHQPPPLPRNNSSSHRLGKRRNSCSRLQFLRRTPSSAINLFEADLNQRLTRVSSGVGCGADHLVGVDPVVNSGSALTGTTGAVERAAAGRLSAPWRPQPSEEDEDEGLAFRIDRSCSWGGQERRHQQQQRTEKKKLSEVHTVLLRHFLHL